MRSVFKLLGLAEEGVRVRDPASLERIAEALEHTGPRARYLASYAYVLARVAHADHEISEDEIAVMEQRVERVGGLPPEHAQLAVEIATSHALELGGTENYVVTRSFRELSTREERLALLECLFAVAAADDNITTAENHEISQIGSEIGLSHQEIAAVRGSYREHLSVLKGLPGRGGEKS